MLKEGLDQNYKDLVEINGGDVQKVLPKPNLGMKPPKSSEVDDMLNKISEVGLDQFLKDSIPDAPEGGDQS